MTAPHRGGQTLLLLHDTFAVCRLPADANIPPCVRGSFFSITRTADELSLVCREDQIPDGCHCEKGLSCLRVAGTLDFSLVGILSSLLVPLADAAVSVFVLSTFDTDYLLLRTVDLAKAHEVLSAAGHRLA